MSITHLLDAHLPKVDDVKSPRPIARGLQTVSRLVFVQKRGVDPSRKYLIQHQKSIILRAKKYYFATQESRAFSDSIKMVEAGWGKPKQSLIGGGKGDGPLIVEIIDRARK